VLGDDAERLRVFAAVDFTTGLVLLTVVTVAATAYAGRRLQSLRLSDDS
jgi:ABC-2 type transport system permease protein